MEVSNSAVKIPDAESETPTRIQPGKLLPLPSSTNGVLKRHAPPQLHHGHPVVVTYKECLKNHAATLGGHALDGCGEFIPALASNPADPTSLKCAACGCHRNFHRREPDDHLLANAVAPALEYRPHHRHHPPPPPIPPNSGSPDNSPSPPPISSAYYPSAPHMLLALSHGMPGPPPDCHALISASAVGGGGINTSPPLSSSSRKRFRTKFTQNQKEKMLEFAESIGWRIQRKDEDLINEFCCDVGVEKGVLKVWMHNHKNNFGKKDHQSNSPPPPATSNGGEMNHTAAEDGDSKENVQLQELRHHNDHQHDDNSNLARSQSKPARSLCPPSCGIQFTELQNQLDKGNQRRILHLLCPELQSPIPNSKSEVP